MDLESFSEWAVSLNDTQRAFIAWNAERLGITEDEARRRYFASWQALDFGHEGGRFRRFGDIMHSLYGVFFDDSPDELYEAYQFHARMHFLRMLSYNTPKIDPENEVILWLASRDRPVIVDFGCGLAHLSRGVARLLGGMGKEARLVLADIPTLRKDFLLWLGARDGVEIAFLDCTVERPLPDLPPSDLSIATEVFEHLHDPIPVFEALTDRLAPGGFLITNVADHQAEPFHVTPDLSELRRRLADGPFDERIPRRLFRKTT